MDYRINAKIINTDNRIVVSRTTSVNWAVYAFELTLSLQIFLKFLSPKIQEKELRFNMTKIISHTEKTNTSVVKIKFAVLVVGINIEKLIMPQIATITANNSIIRI